MTYEPLHHKYRPQTFAELVGQGAIAQTLSNALRQQRIAPAYLFTGARGTGKTSSARIFAKSLNCQTGDVPTDAPCGMCEVCRAIARGSALDVIEIDAASNTGVDNIRELIERAQFAPVQCRYKVYIVDEVHMLSTAAFNALLKTLEEPPDRVVFVLATTDPQRVLPTIISRCQRFDFRRIPLDEMVAHLGVIAAKEAIEIASDAVQLVAQISQGGLRDAESLLDQLSLLQGQITVERVWDLVGAVPERDLLQLVQAIAQDDPALVLETTRHLMDRGREPLIVLQNLASFYRDLLIAKTAPTRNDLVAVTPPTWAEMCQFTSTADLGWILAGQKHLKTSEVQVRSTSQPRLWLEVTLMGLLPSAVSAQPSVGQTAPLGTVQRTPVTPPPTPAPPKPAPTATNGRSSAPPVPASPPSPPVSEPITASHSPDRPPVSPATPPQETPPEPERVEAIAASSAANSSTVQGNIQQIWQEVLALMQPFSTQIMLRQQCYLIAINGQEARIGVNSQPLFKMAKDRVPNIEAAFQQYYNHPVRVSLEVPTPTDASPTPQAPTGVRSQESGVRSQEPPPVPHHTPHTQHPTTPHTQHPTPRTNGQTPAPPTKEQPSTYSSTSPVPAAQNGAGIQTSMPSQQPSVDAGEPLAPPPMVWQEEDEVRRAAKSFAQMFNGQIVSLDSDLELLPGIEASPVLQAAAALDSTDADDDDDDVPF